MTICIGFIHKRKSDKAPGTIILASDSRISDGNKVTDDGKKIVSIKFKNGYALMAKAGYRHSFNRFEEIMAEKAGGTEIKTYRTIPNLADDAIRELQRELLDRNVGDAAKRLEDNKCEFIIAFFHDKKPYLYTINLITRLAEKVDRNFIAIGDGHTLADFLLTAIDPSQMNGSAPFRAAIAVIEMCKVHDSSCGGPCRFGMIGFNPESAPFIAPSAVIQSVSKSLGFADKTHKKLLRLFANNFRFPNE